MCSNTNNEVLRLKEELGLLKISFGHQVTLLHSCEEALAGRDEEINDLRCQLHNAEAYAYNLESELSRSCV